MIYVRSLSSEWRNGMCVAAFIMWKIDELQGALNNMHSKSRIPFSSCDYFCEEICQSISPFSV
jgi:hypothetical protein